MVARLNNFRQSDVKRVLNAAQAAGLEIGRVDVKPDGGISIYVSSTGNDDQSPEAALVKWRAGRAG